MLTADLMTSTRVFSVEAGEHYALREHLVLGLQREAERLPEEAQQLGELRVGIVGMGSVGSKVAVSLARAGLRRFLLVDDDVLVPANVQRHELNWSSVGMHKAQAVNEELLRVAPGMDVTARMHRIAGQESAASVASLFKDLSGCDLLVDATANPEVFPRLAALARSGKIPLVWGEVFATGYGGLIARSRPDLDPNPIGVRDSLHAYLATLPPAPFQDAAGYDGSEERAGIAFDSDVGVIANALTRLAIDTVLSRMPSYFPSPVYLLGLRHEWIFKEPFDTRPVQVAGDGWEPGAPAVSDERRLESLNALVSLFPESKDADDSTAA